MAERRNFTCRTLQAGKACTYGCMPHRILCHAFLNNTCSVLGARYCDNGWHERVEYDTKLQYEEKVYQKHEYDEYDTKSSSTMLDNARPQVRLRSVAPPRKSTKRPHSEGLPRTTEEDTDTDIEIQLNISLCQLELYAGIPELEELETAYRTKMRATQGNTRDQALTTKALKFVHAKLQRKNPK